MTLSSKKKWLFRLSRFYDEKRIWPNRALSRYLYSISTVGTFKGIHIAEIHPRATEDPASIVRIVKDALELIERKDPRRFRLIQREVKFIVNEVVAPDGAQYHRFARLISTDLTRYCERIEADKEHYDWYVASLATTFVHEATHGRIFSFHIAYTKPLRERIESLCCREQKRFASRLDTTRYDFTNTLVADFDPVRWQESWNATPWQRMKKYVKHCREKEE